MVTEFNISAILYYEFHWGIKVVLLDIVDHLSNSNTST